MFTFSGRTDCMIDRISDASHDVTVSTVSTLQCFYWCM